MDSALPLRVTGDRPRDNLLRAIAVFKFAKALLFLALILAARQLLQPGVAAMVQDWAATVPFDVGKHQVRQLLGWLSGLDPHHMAILDLVSLLYAALFTVEGVGLWRGRRWAEWLTVVATASLVPLEIWELARRATIGKGAVLALNLAIVAFLVQRLRPPRAGA